MIGRSGTLRPFAVAMPSPLNCSVTRETDGVPLLSTSAPAWVHHAVQEPQLPSPDMTASTFWVRPSISSTYFWGIAPVPGPM